MSTPSNWMQRIHVAQGFPKPSTDAAPTALFLALFFLGALSNIFIFLRNNKRGHKFIFNGLCIGFCMARVVTTSLRLAWMYNIESRNLALAATIFVAAGVLLLFLINLMFAQRILRGLHPHLGWHKALSTTFLILYSLIPLLLVMVVTASVQAFFTTHPRVAMIDLDLQRTASTYFMFFSFLPIPIVVFALAYPKKNEPDHFGKDSFYKKSVVVLTASVLLCLGASFRTGTIFSTIDRQNPPWFNDKWCFYFFNFTLELLVVILYLVLRIDLIFHVPNGSKGPYSYSRRNVTRSAEDVETRGLQRSSTDRFHQGDERPHTAETAIVHEKIGV